MTARRKLPPFGAEAARVTDIRVYFGADDGAWRMAKWTNEHNPRARALVLPRGQDPMAYRWPVAGAEVVAIQRGFAPKPLGRRLARALLEHGAKSVQLVEREEGDSDVLPF